MDIIVQKIKEVTLITLKGNLLGENNAKPINDIVVDAIKNNEPNIIYDVKDLKYINSTGLSILISTLTKSRKAGGNLFLINIPNQLDSLLKITKLDEIFPECKDLEDALGRFNS